MTKLISVVIPTYNPHPGRLSRVLEGLKMQTFATDEWELIIIDNNSSEQFADQIKLDFQPHSRIIKEAKQGLTHARIAGFKAAQGDIIILVDDDNVLDKDYFAESRRIMGNNAKLAAIGGRIAPEFEVPPPEWLAQFNGLLALVDHGDEPLVSKGARPYPKNAPVGAGMVLRKAALLAYVQRISHGKGFISDRTAATLSSGGDNDIILTMLNQGWETGYFPSLALKHIIPAGRMKYRYLASLNKASTESWVSLLENYAMSPWPKIAAYTLPFRKIKAWFTYRAWAGPANFIKWQGACGMFNALAKNGH